MPEQLRAVAPEHVEAAERQAARNGRVMADLHIDAAGP
jgi:hypothetical protein